MKNVRNEKLPRLRTFAWLFGLLGLFCAVAACFGAHDPELIGISWGLLLLGSLLMESAKLQRRVLELEQLVSDDNVERYR